MQDQELNHIEYNVVIGKPISALVGLGIRLSNNIMKNSLILVNQKIF